MLTLFWLMFTTILGSLITNMYFAQNFISVNYAILAGAGIGFGIGLILRFAPSVLGDIAEAIVD